MISVRIAALVAFLALSAGNAHSEDAISATDDAQATEAAFVGWFDGNDDGSLDAKELRALLERYGLESGASFADWDTDASGGVTPEELHAALHEASR